MKTIIFLTILAMSGLAQGAAPLFESDATLAISIEAPIRELIRKRASKPEFDAIVRYTDPSGEVRILNAKLASRGNARLEACDFPPLRLEFDPAETAGTPFEGQRKLKMVTQCNRGSTAESWLFIEYGIYVAYNAISDFSYRVRKLDVTYQDSESSHWSRNTPAFFIEATGAAAARLDHDFVRPPEVKTAQFDAGELTNNLLFQFLVANTDFAVKRGPSGEGCCHNGRVLAEPGEQDGWIVIPYDFDQAGVINTDYSLPDERLGIRNVTNRLYRGFCWQNDSLPGVIAIFNEKRETITDALVPVEISSSKQKRIGRFVDRFYEIINDPKELQKRILDKCRGATTFAIRKTRTAGQ